MEKKIIKLNNIKLSNIYHFISQIIHNDKKKFYINQHQVLLYLKTEYVIHLDQNTYQEFKYNLQHIKDSVYCQTTILKLLEIAELPKKFRMPQDELEIIIKNYFLDYRFGLLAKVIDEYKDYSKSDMYFIINRYKEKKETWDIINDIITTHVGLTN